MQPPRSYYQRTECDHSLQQLPRGSSGMVMSSLCVNVTSIEFCQVQGSMLGRDSSLAWAKKVAASPSTASRLTGET